MTMMNDLIKMPRTHPVGVLVTHIPLFVLWIAFAARDVTDGSLKVKGQGHVTSASNPLLFYFIAALIVIIAIVIAIRIVQAGFSLANKHDA